MRIAFILQKTLGDVIIGNVLIKNIKLKYPDSEIDWFVSEEYNDLVKYNKNVTNVINLEPWDDVLKRICTGYDIVYVPAQTNYIDNIWHQKEEYSGMHLLDFYASKIDLEIKDRKLELFTNPDAVSVLYNKSPFVVIHTKTLVDVKDWDKFNDLARELVLKNINVIQLKGKNDNAIDGCKVLEMNLSDVIVFLKSNKIDCFIGLDSGLSYAAASFDIPVISIQGATSDTTSGAYGNNVIHLTAQSNDSCKKERNNIKCHGLGGGKCVHGIKCINKIEVVDVIRTVEKVIQGGQNG